jgi:hypothetical protein
MSTTTSASAMYVIRLVITFFVIVLRLLRSIARASGRVSMLRGIFVIVLAGGASIADAQFIHEQRLDEVIKLLVLLHFFQRDFLSVFIRQHEVAEVEVLTMVEVKLGCEVVVFTLKGNFFFVCVHVKVFRTFR